MPIDDALEKISTETSSHDKKEQLIQVPSSIFSKAQDLLGEYLVEKYFKSDNIANLKIFLKTIGPFVLKFSPKKYSNQAFSHRSREQSCSLVETIDKETWKRCITSFAQGYLENTDICEIEEPFDLKKEGENYIPELNAVKSLCSGKYRTESSPYDLVMGMNPKYRPLIAVSIGNALANNEIMISADAGTSLKNILFSSIPPLKCIAETAKEYEVREIKPAIADLNRIVQEYSDNW